MAKGYHSKSVLERFNLLLSVLARPTFQQLANSLFQQPIALGVGAEIGCLSPYSGSVALPFYVAECSI